MANEQGGAEVDVKIRAPTRRAWILLFVLGGTYFAVAAHFLTAGWPWFLFGLIPLPVGGWLIAIALGLRTLGVDLTPKSAIVRGFHGRRNVPWLEVQSVVSQLNSDGTSVAWLILENGESVKLRYPTTLWRKGDAQYERDLQLIDQWWLAHRGDSWRSASPEAPPPPAQK